MKKFLAEILPLSELAALEQRVNRYCQARNRDDEKKLDGLFSVNPLTIPWRYAKEGELHGDMFVVIMHTVYYSLVQLYKILLILWLFFQLVFWSANNITMAQMANLSEQVPLQLQTHKPEIYQPLAEEIRDCILECRKLQNPVSAGPDTDEAAFGGHFMVSFLHKFFYYAVLRYNPLYHIFARLRKRFYRARRYYLEQEALQETLPSDTRP